MAAKDAEHGGGLADPTLPAVRCHAEARNQRRRSGLSHFGALGRESLTGKGSSTAARAWPAGEAAVERAGRRGSRLRAREATPCRRGALGGDSEVRPGRPADGVVPAVKELGAGLVDSS
jgi:hypothetical protein